MVSVPCGLYQASFSTQCISYFVNKIINLSREHQASLDENREIIVPWLDLG